MGRLEANCYECGIDQSAAENRMATSKISNGNSIRVYKAFDGVMSSPVEIDMTNVNREIYVLLGGNGELSLITMWLGSANLVRISNGGLFTPSLEGKKLIITPSDTSGLTKYILLRCG